MAEGAAIVNRSGRLEREPFDAVLGASSAEIVELAHAVRVLVL